MIFPSSRLKSILCLCLLAAAAACGQAGTQEGGLRYGLTLAPSGIDPHIHASVELGIPLSSVYDTLVFLDPETGQFVPGLAERWEVTPDGLRYTFHLRQDVVFHDGSPFNAEAVRANLSRVLDPENRSQRALSMLGPLREVQVLDEFTVALDLEAPYAPLLDSLSQVYLGMASPQALEQWGPADYQFHQVGTGPYRFVEYLPNDRLILERNPDYAWAPAIYRGSDAAIDTITFRFYEDVATRALALESGEVDVIGELPALEARRLAEAGEFEIYPVEIPGQPLQYFFNTQRPPTDDPRVREALVLGVDRAAIVRTIFGEYSPVAQGPLAAVTLGFSPRQDFGGYDPEGAAELLDSAGWQPDTQGRRARNGDPLQLLLIAPNWGSNPEVGQLLASAWEALGAQVELQVAPGFGPLNEVQQRGEYHAIGMNTFGSDPDLLRPFFASDGFFNWSGYRDAGLDSLLDKAAQSSTSEDARLALYAGVAGKIREQWLILPVRDYVNLVGASRDLQGLRFSAQGWFPYLIELSWRR
jgi:peptide/nickel transport system substrate-binding protein